ILCKSIDRILAAARRLEYRRTPPVDAFSGIAGSERLRPEARFETFELDDDVRGRFEPRRKPLCEGRVAAMAEYGRERLLEELLGFLLERGGERRRREEQADEQHIAYQLRRQG